MKQILENWTGNKLLLSSGTLMDPLNAKPSDIKIEDIAKALSRMPRFAGHTKEPYSVAQHCLRCLQFAENDWKLEVLLHDASEAYLMDMPKPIKHRFPEYMEAEKNLEKVIDNVFSLNSEIHKNKIKLIDSMVLDEEIKHLMNHGEDFMKHPWYESAKHISSIEVEKFFLEAFYVLNNCRLRKNIKY